jgi:hypothetical protein
VHFKEDLGVLCVGLVQGKEDLGVISCVQDITDRLFCRIEELRGKGV